MRTKKVAYVLIGFSLLFVAFFFGSTARAATVQPNSVPLEFIVAIKNTNTATATMTAEVGQMVCLGDRVNGKLDISCQNGPAEVQLSKGDAAWKYGGTLDSSDRVISVEGSVQHDLSLSNCELLGLMEMNSFHDETPTRLLDTDAILLATLEGADIAESAKIPAHKAYIVNVRNLNAIVITGGNDSALIAFCLKAVGQDPTPPDPEHPQPENCFWVSLNGPFVKGLPMKWEVQNLCKYGQVWDAYTSIELTKFSDQRCSEMLAGRPIVGLDLYAFACPLPPFGEKYVYTAIPQNCGKLSWWAWHVTEAGIIEPFEMFNVNIDCRVHMPLVRR